MLQQVLQQANFVSRSTARCCHLGNIVTNKIPRSQHLTGYGRDVETIYHIPITLRQRLFILTIRKITFGIPHNNKPSEFLSFRIFIATHNIDIEILSVRPSVCPLPSGILWKRLIVIVSSQHGSPIILVLWVSDVFAKFRRDHPLRARAQPLGGWRGGGGWTPQLSGKPPTFDTTFLWGGGPPSSQQSEFGV